MFEKRTRTVIMPDGITRRDTIYRGENGRTGREEVTVHRRRMFRPGEPFEEVPITPFRDNTRGGRDVDELLTKVGTGRPIDRPPPKGGGGPGKGGAAEGVGRGRRGRGL